MKSVLLILLTIFCLAGCVPKPESHILAAARSDFHEKNYENAFYSLLPLAKKGNAQAQYSIGYMYYYGLGVAEDNQKAKLWIEKSAKNGNQNAIRALEIEKFHYAGV